MTDLSLNNILLAFEDDATLIEYAEKQIAHPVEYMLNPSGHTVYGKLDIFPVPSFPLCPEISDFGSADIFETDGEVGAMMVQPICYRAPEVILGRGHSMSADIWNFGCMVRSQLRSSPYEKLTRGNTAMGPL